MREASSKAQHSLVITPLPMRIALILSVALVLYTGILPSAAIEMARNSIEGLGTFGGGLIGLGP
jgi:hypothetical protein